MKHSDIIINTLSYRKQHQLNM